MKQSMKNKYCPINHDLMTDNFVCAVCKALDRQREDMEKEIEKSYHKGYCEGISIKQIKLPNKIKIKHAIDSGSEGGAGYTIGWNACIDKIKSLKGGDKL